jgi:hypothetical protein
MGVLCISRFHHFTFFENKIYQKMQREKLYNLHRTAYFLVALLVFKMDKNLKGQILPVRKWDVFEFGFSYFIFLLLDVFYLKKIKYTKRCSVKSPTIYEEQIRKRWNKKKTNSSCTQKISFLHCRNLIPQTFVHFKNKKCN